MKLSNIQRRILATLSESPGGLTSEQLRIAVGARFIRVNTTNMLRNHDCVLQNCGTYFITAIGRTAAETGIRP